MRVTPPPSWSTEPTTSVLSLARTLVPCRHWITSWNGRIQHVGIPLARCLILPSLANIEDAINYFPRTFAHPSSPVYCVPAHVHPNDYVLLIRVATELPFALQMSQRPFIKSWPLRLLVLGLSPIWPGRHAPRLVPFNFSPSRFFFALERSTAWEKRRSTTSL